MNHRILIVDDDPDICDLAALILEWTGRYSVASETRATTALETAKTFLPDLILLDLTMPRKSGAEVAREIADEPALAGALVVFMTGHGPPVHSGERSGALHLSKPFGSGELVTAMGRFLAERPSR